MTEEEGEEPMVKTDTSHVQQLTTNTHSCIDEEGEGEVRSKSLLSILEYRFKEQGLPLTSSRFFVIYRVNGVHMPSVYELYKYR